MELPAEGNVGGRRPAERIPERAQLAGIAPFPGRGGSEEALKDGQEAGLSEGAMAATLRTLACSRESRNCLCGQREAGRTV
ncbi:hypothetical protein GCM10009825_08880 [Arthrobacter humicola]|uniref:Uncharacterized protein n=1 Tax=Arthrobacter humicola TaxID=409291 RepID=A0ABN2YLG4_9MICC